MADATVYQAQANELSQKLWAIANNLRGNMDASKFKNYILGLIFYRYLSERTVTYMSDLLKNDGVTYDEAFADEDFRPIVEQWSLSHLGYVIQPKNLFSNLVRKINAPVNDDDKFSVADLQKAVNELTASTMGHGSNKAFNGLFADMRLDDSELGDTVSARTKLIGQVMSQIANIDFNLEDAEFDVLGTAYMILIGLFQSQAGKKGGEFFTPAGPSKLCAMLAAQGLESAKTVGDCTCGSASMLLEVQKHLSGRKVGHYYGQEKNGTTYNLARMNMIMHGVNWQDFDIYKADTLLEDKYYKEDEETGSSEIVPMTIQVCNPPYSLKWDAPASMLDDPRYSGAGKLAPKGHADFAFLEHMVHHMDEEDGRVAVLLPHGVLFRGNAEEDIRKYLIDTLNRLDAVIGLPANLFHGTAIGIEIDYSTMAEVVNHITLYDNGYAFLNDDEGNIIYHPQMDVTTMEAQPKVPSGLLSNDKFIRYTYDGVEKQAVWLPLSNGMRLNVTVPVREINAAWHKWNAEIAITFAVLLAVFIVLIMSFVGRITNPLRKLTKAAEQISEGYYDTELDYDKKDEVGVLTASFKKLIMNLNVYIKNLNDMAYIDALTGIGNRLSLRRDYDAYLGKEVTVMMMDLNDFKLINDSRGHDEGDRILKEVGKLLANTFGVEHCYRYGGDEFLVIVPEISNTEFQEKLEYLKQNKPIIEDTASADFSIGYVRATLSDSDILRTLISRADEKMYEAKRDRNRASASGRRNTQPQMKATEYTVEELKTFLKEMSERYALARVVDPIECRIIELQDDGEINMNESCYGIWNAEQKCINCSSALACKTGCHQEKAEHFKDNYYFVQSNPVKLKLSNGSLYDAVVELVNVEKESEVAVNNREAENVGTRAAHYLAHHDSLTNALNADSFYELARGMIKNRSDKSWVMITSNIMNFRLVNTLFGDQKGNEVLAKTAALLREISESSRGLCGRLGSDQFAVLIPKNKYREEHLSNIAQTLSDNYNSGIYTLHIHFGVYEIDDPSIPVSVMCGRANSALRTIREDLSKTVAYFDDAILQKILLEQTVLGSFEEALSSGQFKMYLQPLVRKDGSVLGAEALARWYRPDGTMVMPGDFIETLETAGLIHKLDRYMWELAAKQLSLWKETERQNFFISVNVSAKDFYSIDVVDVMTKLVEKYGVDSRMLRLEITETALLGNPDKCDSIISGLRQKGFLVEIDDFGKDNSTLSFLKDIKADVLKIDMSFLHEIKDRERSRIILKSVISMADSLGMDVITEGVETEQQLLSLSAMGCNHFQGYFFSRPIPVDEFEMKYSSVD